MLEVHQHRQPADRHQHPADARSSSPGLLAFIPLSVAHSAVSMAVVEDPVRPVVVPRWGRGPGGCTGTPRSWPGPLNLAVLLTHSG